MKRYITEKNLMEYQEHLYEEEKSSATIQKYLCDLKKLQAYAGEKELTKKGMIEYKEMLKDSHKYRLSSINSFLVAANRFFEYMGWYELKIKTFRIQKEAFLPENRNPGQRAVRDYGSQRKTGDGRYILQGKSPADSDSEGIAEKIAVLYREKRDRPWGCFPDCQWENRGSE